MKIKILIACILLAAACSAGSPASNPSIRQNGQDGAAKSPEPDKNGTNGPDIARQNGNTTAKQGADNCPAVKRKGKIQIKAQTFPFSYKPFTDMCFVTFASSDQMLDERDVPRGSTFHLYRNGESVLDLPDAFDGQEACWVEGVSFKDLNGDGFTDIIIAGSCLGAKDSYPANAVIVNNGKDFETDADANQKLESFRKLSEIESYVKRNLSLFF